MSNFAGQTFAFSTALLQAPTAFLERGFAFARRARTPSTPPAFVREINLGREMTFSRTDTATECHLRIEGALDMNTAPELRAVFDAILFAQPRRVVLELEGLTMIDSSGVGAIVSLFKRVHAAGGDVVVRGVQAQPLAVCKLLKLDRVFGL